jgi:hypothetical protein
MNDLLDTLVQHLGAEQRRDGRFHSDCPFCGKEAKRGQKHFSFAAEGYTCWVCDAKGGLRALAERLAVGGELVICPRPAPKPIEPRHWQTDPRVLARYTGALDVVTAWSSYKPLTLDTIARARLGVGVLPASRCPHRRLILPVFAGDRLVALHGRAFLPGDDDAKWLSAGGSRKDVLYGAHLLRPGATVVICENFVDSLLAQQAEPSVVAVAGGGVSWQDTWTAQIAASRPRHVLVWLDHDLVGNGSRYHHDELVEEWFRRNPRATSAPEAKGPQIANALLKAGVRASVYQWPSGTPLRADLGWVLMKMCERKVSSRRSG